MMDKETMIKILAEQGIFYNPQPVTVERAGRTVKTTTTFDPQLDIYDLATALLDGSISNNDAVTKLLHISTLLADKFGNRGAIEECLAALRERTAWRMIDANPLHEFHTEQGA